MNMNYLLAIKNMVVLRKTVFLMQTVPPCGHIECGSFGPIKSINE